MKRGKKNKKTLGTDSATSNRIVFLSALLNSYKVAYLYAGGVAANLHGHVRATKDLDILIPKDLKNTENLLEALSDLPYGIAKELDAQDVLKRAITIVGDSPRVDILTSAWNVKYADAFPRRVERKIQGVKIAYLSLADLIESKKSSRPQDLADIIALQGIEEE